MNPAPRTSGALTVVDRTRLLVLARACLEARVRREPRPPIARGGALDAPRGAFVSIHAAGALRGCLGHLTSPCLAVAVADLAAAVADSDPRFEPVAAAELTLLHLEISVLTPEREVHSLEDIEVGRHGLIVEQGLRHGLLLPQVASERGWDRTTFAEQTCVKAGLLPDAWRRGARILCFEAEVFAESMDRWSMI